MTPAISPNDALIFAVQQELTPLAMASASNQKYLVKVLLTMHGIDVNKKDSVVRTSSVATRLRLIVRDRVG